LNGCVEGDKSKGGDLYTAEAGDVDTTGDEAGNARARSRDNAAAALSLRHLVSGIRG